MLAETVTIAAVGGALGVMLARWGVEAAMAQWHAWEANRFLPPEQQRPLTKPDVSLADCQELHRLLLGRQHADLQRAERPPGIPVTHLGEEFERFGAHVDRPIPQPALPIGQRALEHKLDLCTRKGLERENLTAAKQGRVDGEEGILRGGADQNDAPFFDIGQQDILLGAVETVQFIHK